MTRSLVASTIVAFFLTACAENADSLNGRRNRAGGETPGETPGGEAPTDPAPGAVCEGGLPHVGFAGINFVSDREPGMIGDNRRRVKPYSALDSEFQRALGTVPAALAQSVAAYGQVPARWYSEPTAGAVAAYTTYTLAFTACYDTMTAAAYTQMPTATTAAAECAKMQRTIWQRTPTTEEIQACSTLATGLTEEASARRRWAHACASIMTATGFTTY